MNNVIAYIDGFNLYYGLRTKGSKQKAVGRRYV